jgi:hypothetical protein
LRGVSVANVDYLEVILSNKVESILFKKVELWFVLLLVVVILVLAVFFASAVRHQATGGRRLGAVGPVVDAVAGFPTLVGAVFRGEGGKNDLLAPEQRFAAERGLKVFADNADRDDYGYVLVNRYDGDSGCSV